MPTFITPRFPQSGSSIKADWGKKLVEAVRERTIVPQVGQRLHRTAYGTIIETDRKAEEYDEDLTDNDYAFKVRWFPYDREANDKGEWQICLPYGCATITQETSRSYNPVNDPAKNADGEEIYKWYRIEKPQDKDATVGRFKDYVAVQWTVRVLFAPFPLMKAVTCEKDKDFKEKWSVAVATISEVRFDDRTLHGTTRYAVDPETVHFVWPQGEFAINYEFKDNGGTYSAVPRVINQTKMIGRLQVYNIEPKDVSGSKSVWIKIEHPSTQFKLTVETDLTGKDTLSSDDRTVYKIYDLEDDVVVNDYRDKIPEMNFYTNGPEVPEDDDNR